MSFKDKLRIVLDDLEAMLLEKNRKYGDSALNPARVFSKADPVEQIKVRIDDKLSRLVRMEPDEDEDVVLDLMGYLVLLRLAKGKEDAKEVDAAPNGLGEEPEPSERVLVDAQLDLFFRSRLADMWDYAVANWDRDVLLWMAIIPFPWGFTENTVKRILCALIKGTKEGSVSVWGRLMTEDPDAAAVVTLQESHLDGNTPAEQVRAAVERVGLGTVSSQESEALLKVVTHVLAKDPRQVLRACADGCLKGLEDISKGTLFNKYPTDARHSQVMVLASFGNPFREGEKP